MSVAFTKEDSAATASEVLLPDRPISPEPNLATARGLQQLEQQLAEARQAFEAANRIEDVNERRQHSAGPLRALRYLGERVRSAQLVENPQGTAIVTFGSTVTFRRETGRQQTYRIVGEDEADPGQGSISYVSPIARLLMGKSIGDSIVLNGQNLEIIAIS